MPRNLLVLAVAALVALWATVEFAGKAWELFTAGKLFFAVMSAGIAGFAAYLLQGYVRLIAGLALRGASPRDGSPPAPLSPAPPPASPPVQPPPAPPPASPSVPSGRGAGEPPAPG